MNPKMRRPMQLLKCRVSGKIGSEKIGFVCLAAVQILNTLALLVSISCSILVQSTEPRVVEFIAELHNITVMEGEDATFKCVLSPEDAQLAWCMNGKPIVADEKFTMSSSGLSHSLHIHNCQVGDTSRVTAEAEGVVSKASLRVQGEVLKSYSYFLSVLCLMHLA